MNPVTYLVKILFDSGSTKQQASVAADAFKNLEKAAREAGDAIAGISGGGKGSKGGKGGGGSGGSAATGGGLLAAGKNLKQLLAGLGLYTAYRSLSNVSKAAISTADANADLADEIGISTTELQAQVAVIEAGRGRAEDLATAYKVLKVAMEEATSNPKGDHASAFAKLGIAMEFVRRASPDDVMKALSLQLERLPANAETFRTALILLGRSGDRILPQLRDNFIAASEAMKASSQVMSEATNAALAETDDALRKLWRNIRTRVGNLLLPGGVNVLKIGADATSKAFEFYEEDQRSGDRYASMIDPRLPKGPAITSFDDAVNAVPNTVARLYAGLLVSMHEQSVRSKFMEDKLAEIAEASKQTAANTEELK